MPSPKSSDLPFTTGGNSMDNGPVMDSTNATVMAMASGYDLKTNKIFVGSLRKSGFKGNIILAVKPDIDPQIKVYLEANGVTLKFIVRTDCSYVPDEGDGKRYNKESLTCLHPYPDLKQRWSRFPLLRDYLIECKECTGPVLVTDFRDTFFQRDPFGDGGHHITGLEVFREHHTQRTSHWLVEWPVEKCKGVGIRPEATMLCSGTTIGTRTAMLEYLTAMHEEMREWMATPNCRNIVNGDDQSIHNYLFYSGKLSSAVAMPNRQGIVNTVGVQGSMIRKYLNGTYDGANENKGQWIGLHYDVTDEEGYLTNIDGTKSRVVHQYDRFGPPLNRWLDMKERDLWV